MNPYSPPQTPGYPPPAAPVGPDAQQTRSRILFPAITLTVVSGILILVFALDVVLAATGDLRTPGPALGGGIEQLITPGFLIGVCLFAMLLNAFVVFSMIQMMRLRSWGLALAGCIVAALPLSSSACCLLTLPFAIWAIVVLAKPEVKASFQ
jgi:hypothetical protein